MLQCLRIPCLDAGLHAWEQPFAMVGHMNSCLPDASCLRRAPITCSWTAAHGHLLL